MPESNVGDLVECGFLWEFSKGIYSDFAPVREPLNIPVQLVKRVRVMFRAQSAVSMSKPGIGETGVSSPSVCASTNQYA
jgi:hypothetical protein